MDGPSAVACDHAVEGMTPFQLVTEVPCCFRRVAVLLMDALDADDTEAREVPGNAVAVGEDNGQFRAP